jgi:hypothetical protein
MLLKEREDCCIIVSDQFSSQGSTAALNHFQSQTCGSKIGRGRKRHRNSRKGIDESDPTQKRQGEEIATPTPCMISRRGRPEEKEHMNPGDLS